MQIYSEKLYAKENEKYKKMPFLLVKQEKLSFGITERIPFDEEQILIVDIP